MAVDYRKLWIRLAEKDMSKAVFRETCVLSPATMTKLNKNSYVNLEILERICRTLNCDIGDIVGLMPDAVIEKEFRDGKQQPGALHLRFIAFVGNFKEGRRILKKAVYFAGGAPSDKVRAFTEYLVVGKGGEQTNLYRENEENIKKGFLVTLTPQRLKDIIAGQAALPERISDCDPCDSDPTVSRSEDADRGAKERQWSVWNRARDQFWAELIKAEPHGIPGRDYAKLE